MHDVTLTAEDARPNGGTCSREEKIASAQHKATKCAACQDNTADHHTDPGQHDQDAQQDDEGRGSCSCS